MISALIEIVGLKPAAWLGIVGGALEITGFALVATELVRAQRRELGTAGPFQFVLTVGGWVKVRIRRLLRRNVTIHAAAAMASASSMTARMKVRAGPQNEELSERIRVLEVNFERLDKEVDEQRQELVQRIEKQAEAQSEALAEFRTQVEEREEAERTAFADSAKLQWWGIGLFVLGAAASAAANVVGAS